MWQKFISTLCPSVFSMIRSISTLCLSVFIMTRGLFYFVCLYYDQRFILLCLYYDQRFIPLFVFPSLLWSEVYSTLCLSDFIMSRGLYHSLSLPFCGQRFIPLFTLQSLLVSNVDKTSVVLSASSPESYSNSQLTHTTELNHTAWVSLHTQLSSVIQHESAYTHNWAQWYSISQLTHTSELSHTAWVSLHTQLSSVVQH